jgi:hypothetical protein
MCIFKQTHIEGNLGFPIVALHAEGHTLIASVCRTEQYGVVLIVY